MSRGSEIARGRGLRLWRARGLRSAGGPLSSLLLTVALPSAGQAPADPAAVVEAFHAALAAGDAARAEALLAPDAVVLEGGHVESRAQYLAHHLAADIAFSRAIAQERSDVRVTTAGDTAWLSARSTADGEWRGRTIRSAGAELIVLSRGPDGWRIRAIHWSSHEREPKAGSAPPSALRDPEKSWGPAKRAASD